MTSIGRSLWRARPRVQEICVSSEIVIARGVVWVVVDLVEPNAEALAM
jgi:hypothetical protein